MVVFTNHQDSQDMNSQVPRDVSDHGEEMPIAVIGMSFKGPGDATSVEKLWEMISEGRESWTRIPKEKWNHEAFYHPDSNRHGTYNVEGGHFFQQDLARFDAPFFHMTAAEAAALDPQQRLLLECSYEAMENAGIPLDQFCGTMTSVFAGAFCTDYTDILWRDPESTPMYQCTNAGNSRANIANRLSYFFDLHGPSVSVDTACSTSLVGLHLGCQSLRTGDAKLSLVAGASVILSHEAWITMSMMRFLSPDGRCYTFDERANGYARGEGTGVLLLKPLADALKDGDTIRAVIRATGSSQDGKTPGITMPNGIAQEELFRSVYASIGLDPTETSYVECHGTGTQAGDPLETGAVSRFFCAGRSGDNPLRIGSVKTNVGHLEAASGVAGVVKAVLMLENEVYLPNRNFEKINPRIPLEEWKLKIPLAVEPWEGPLPRRASVNSFGYGGAIAHVILESAKDYLSTYRHKGNTRTVKSLRTTSTPHLNGLSNGHAYSNGHSNGLTNGCTQQSHGRVFSISAFDETAGKAKMSAVAKYLEDRISIADESFLNNLAYTLNERQTRHVFNAAVYGRSATNLIEKLRNGPGLFGKATKKPRLGFVFTGQGAQWCGMGKELIDAYAPFKQSLERSTTCLINAGAPFNVIDELTRDPKGSHINLALYSQPLCTAVQIAVVDLLSTWGIEPLSVTGHSSGEIAAAYALGALSLEDAMLVAYFRGVASSNLAAKGLGKGSMMAVGMSKDAALPLIKTLTQGKAVVACSNSPASITVSGDEPAVDELFLILEKKKIFARKLVVEVAYHSHHMLAVAEEYRSSLSSIELLEPRTDVEFFSSVTGSRVVSSDLGPDYWVENMLSEVKFHQSLSQLCSQTGNSKRSRKRAGASAIDALVEVGPHSALAGPIKQTIQADEKLSGTSIAYYSALVRKTNAIDSVLKLVSGLLTSGYPVSLSKVNNMTGKESVLVDLPPYSWNHSNSYWSESRKSKALRNRPFPRSDLLGALEPSCSPLEPRWCNYIRLYEVPWARDHKIQGNIVYPAAGYIVMAIEAAVQRASQRSVSNITGFKLREISIGAALVIPEDPGEVEVAITLKSFSDSLRSPSDLWDEFVISSVSGEDRWTEHCRGLVSVQTPSKLTNIIDGQVQELAERQFYSDMIADYESKCDKDVDIPRFYEQVTKLGLEYGPTFACMTAARSASTSSFCIGHLKIPDTADVMPKNFQFPFVVHPATLDSIFHTIFVALSAATGEMKDPAVPISVEEIFVSEKISREPGHELVSYTSTEKKDHRYLSASLTVFSDSDSDKALPVISIRDITCASLEREGGQNPSDELQRRAYNLEWQPDVDLLSHQTLEEICQNPPTPDQINLRHKLEMAAFYLLKDVTDTFAKESESVRSTYQQELGSLFKSQVDAMIQKHTGKDSAEFISASDYEKQLILAEAKSSGPEGAFLCQIGEQLPSLLGGGITSSSLLGELDLAKFFGPSDIFLNCKSASKFLKLLGHKNPTLSVLAVGDLSAVASIPVLAGLGPGDKLPPFANFEYTDPEFDISEMIKVKAPAWNGLISRKTLDIEADLSDQDCTLESYDVIVAYHMIGSIKSVQVTLENARKLLKPNGKLLLIGRVLRSLVASTLFGFLPSILAKQIAIEDSHPPMSEEDWTRVLSETHFSRDAVASNSTDKQRQGALFLTAIPEVRPTIKHPDVLIITEDHQSGIPAQLKPVLSGLIITIKFATLEEAQPTSDQVCIVLSELNKDVLINPCMKEWDALKSIFLKSGGVLWVTQGGAVASCKPNNNLVAGFARTVRSETGNVPLMTLDLDAVNRSDDAAAVNVISSLFERYFYVGVNPRDIEHEYAVRAGVLSIPRLVEDVELAEFIATSQDDPKPEMQPFRQSGRPLHMIVGTPGLLDSLYFTDDDRFDDELPSDWVQMEVKATGFNFKDVMMALGQIKVKKLGWEASGVVNALGKDVTGFSIGDRVLCYGAALFSTDYCGPALQFHKIPEHVSFETAAALPVTYATAYYSIHHIAHMQKGETVLIHAASGGLGQALIELCQLIGVEIFATVGTRDKKQFLMEHFKIPESHIFFSRDSSFANGVKRMTNGQGVDVIMNSLAGENLRLTWDCLAPYGRFVELGQRDIMVNTRLEMGQFHKNTTFSAFMLDYLIEQRPAVASKVVADVMDLFRSGAIKGPSPVHAFSICEVEKALQTMQTGGHMGKLVAVNKEGDMVKVIPQDKSKTLLSPHFSYLLVGGLGGIGRATALWMRDHGARNFILVNRSGLKTDEAKETVKALETLGCKVVVYPCDIVDSEAVCSMVAQAKLEMPPIKGLIQGAMILRDGMYEGMSLEDYKTVMLPKVQGTWNLHNHLPEDMDFFIMESSISGIIGNATQAAYAAGNTFLDAFAAYRHSLGMAATSIDLPAISDIGYLATNTELKDAMKRQGFDLVDQKVLMSLLHFAIANPRRPGSLSQAIIGLGSWKEGDSLDTFTLPMFSHFRQLSSRGSTESSSSDSSIKFKKSLRQAKTIDDATDLICSALVGKIASRSGVAVEHINTGNPISDYGIDSLVAVELRNWIAKEIDSAVPIFELLANNPLAQLAVKIAQRSRLVQIEREGGA